MADGRGHDSGEKHDLKVVDRRSATLRDASGGDGRGEHPSTGEVQRVDEGSPTGQGVADEASEAGATVTPGGASGATEARRYPSFVEELKGRTEEAERRLQEVLAAHRQAVADQEEFRKRLSRDVQKRVETETARILAGLVAVYDDLDRAVRHAEEASDPSDSPVASALLQGVRLVRDRFLSALRERGVEKLDVLGSPFDPQTSEALRTVATAPDQDGIVIEEISPGFLYQGQLLRPARVTVGRAGLSSRN